MKKLLSIMLSLIMLTTSFTGCGSGGTTASDSGNQAMNANQNQSGDLCELDLDIILNHDLTIKEASFKMTRYDDYTYSSSELFNDGRQIASIYKTLRGFTPDEDTFVFTGETSQNIDLIFEDFFNKSIKSNMDYIEKTYLKLAKESAAITDPMERMTSSIQDYLELDNLSLKINGDDYEINPQSTRMFIGGSEDSYSETEITGSKIPYYTDEYGHYEYFDRFFINFYIPVNQMAPLYDYFETARAQELQKPEAERAVAVQNIKDIRLFKKFNTSGNTGATTPGQPLQTTGWGGLYSGSNNGVYYYIETVKKSL